MPPGYYEAIEEMRAVLRAWLDEHPSCAPLFRLGPRDVMIVAPLDEQAARFCLNADAVRCAQLLDAVARRRSGDGCTVFMLGVVLQCARVPFVRVSLGELGLSGGIPLAKGGSA